MVALPRPLLYLLLSLLPVLTACPREPLPELVHFAFVLPVTISPGADTVRRGDTLWLSVSFSDSLLDLRSNRRYRVRQQDLTLTASVGFHRLVGPDQFSQGFAQGFSVTNQVGQLLPGGPTFRRFQPVYDGRHYQARIGIVPQVTGVYALSMLSVGNFPTPLRFLPVSPGADGKDRSALLDDIYYVINEGDTHFTLQQQHTRVSTLRPDAPEGAVYYEQKGTFAFVVK